MKNCSQYHYLNFEVTFPTVHLSLSILLEQIQDVSFQESFVGQWLLTSTAFHYYLIIETLFWPYAPMYFSYSNFLIKSFPARLQHLENYYLQIYSIDSWISKSENFRIDVADKSDNQGQGNLHLGLLLPDHLASEVYLLHMTVNIDIVDPINCENDLFYGVLGSLSNSIFII